MEAPTSYMHVTVYTDGASRGNPGPGGYGAVLLYTDPSGQQHTKEFSQGFLETHRLYRL